MSVIRDNAECGKKYDAFIVDHAITPKLSSFESRPHFDYLYPLDRPQICLGAASFYRPNLPVKGVKVWEMEYPS